MSTFRAISGTALVLTLSLAVTPAVAETNTWRTTGMQSRATCPTMTESTGTSRHPRTRSPSSEAMASMRSGRV